MWSDFVLMRQLIAIVIVFFGYSSLYGIGQGEADYGVPRQIVEIFLLVMIFYGIFFIGKIFVWYWRRVDPRPSGKEMLLIGMFEYVYLPIVAVFFPMYIEDVFLVFENEKQNADMFFIMISLLIFILIDSDGGIRNYIYDQSMKMREKSLMKMEDVFNADSQILKRSSLVFYYVVFSLIGVLSFY